MRSRVASPLRTRGALVGTDSALYRDGKLLVAQTMSADGKAFMRIAQLDLQSTAIEVLTEPVVDSVVSVTNNVLAYCEMREGGFAVCLRSLKDGGIASARRATRRWMSSPPNRASRWTTASRRAPSPGWTPPARRWAVRRWMAS